MAEPITWRTVNGPSLAENFRPMEGAQRAILGSFDQLGNVLKQQEATDQANWNQTKENNTQDFLNKLYSVQGPDKFKQLQDSGELDRMIAANGAQIDRAAARSAMDGRLGVLQNREKQGWEYQDASTDRSQLPIVQQILTHAAAGDKDKAMALMQANPDLRMPAPLMDSIVKGDRDFQKWGFTVAEEKQKEAMRPLELTGKKLENAGKATSNATGALNLQQLKQEVADKDEVRALENTLSTAQQKYLADKDAVGRNMGVIAKGANLPLLASGHPDFANMTSAQLDQFDTAAKGNQQVKVPSARDFISGDTRSANDFLKTLQDSGKFRASTLTKYRDNIRAGFNSNANDGMVGNDAANVALARAQNKVKFDEQDASNWYTKDSPNATKAYEQLSSEAESLIDKTSGFAPKEDVADVQAFIHKMGQQGVEVAPGKFLIPSVQDMRNAIRTAGGGWFTDSTRAANAEKILRESVKNSFTTDKLKQAEESAVFRRQQAVRDILNPAK